MKAALFCPFSIRSMFVVLTTMPNAKDAENLGREIVEAKLAACVQVLPQMISFYFWEDRIASDSENLLLIKTLNEKLPALENFINDRHPYDVPEIVVLEAAKVSKSYLKWMTGYLE